MADGDVVTWYEDKTGFLLEKYGPGPRVHYHTGLVDPAAEPARDIEALRRQIVRSQEDMLWHAAQVWDAGRWMRGDVLDVGCGLGGGPIFWAQEFGATVTALTPVPGHLAWIERFAREAGVGARVTPELGDAHVVPGAQRFDAAVATGASNYFDRARWFERLAGLLRPGGRVMIEDTFLGHPAMREPFNAYWLSNIGTRDEYLAAARAAGFELVRCDDVTAHAAGFWRLSAAYSALLLEGGALRPDAVPARHRSIAWQTQVYDAYLDGGFANLLLQFVRSG